MNQNRPPIRSRAGAVVGGLLGGIGLVLLVLGALGVRFGWQDVDDSITVPEGSTVQLDSGRHGIEHPSGEQARDVQVVDSSGQTLELVPAPWDEAQLSFRLSEPDTIRFEGVTGEVRLGDGVSPYAALVIAFSFVALGVGVVLVLAGLVAFLLSARRAAP